MAVGPCDAVDRPYAIQAGRGVPQSAAVLGADFDGVLVRDGWAPYRRFAHAGHQTCLAHLVRRARDLADDRLDFELGQTPLAA